MDKSCWEWRVIGGSVDVNSEEKTRNMSKSEKENHRHSLKRTCTYPGKGSGGGKEGKHTNGKNTRTYAENREGAEGGVGVGGRHNEALESRF